MTAIPNVAADARAGAVAGDPAAPAASGGPFVLNLCSSTTPMALAQTELPELKRFTFFVSRRFEEGRERFRLHMGYFATLAEAEEWLALVREIYPGAWAGEAPGRKLRERAAAAAAAQATHTAGPQPRVAAPRPAAPEVIPVNVPVVHAARPAPSAPPPKARTTAPAAAAHAGPAVHPAARAVAAARATAPATGATASAKPAAARPPQVTAPAPRPTAAPAPAARAPAPGPSAPPAARQATAAGRPAAPIPRPAPLAARPGSSPAPAAHAPRPAPPAARVAPQPARPATAAPAAVARPPSAPAATAASSRPSQPARPGFGNSNVREVLAALTDTTPTGETRQMQAPPPRPAAIEVREEAALSDTQVLKVLEARSAQPGQPMADGSEGGIPLLKPDDTATRRALQEAINNNAPVSFAVQLQWSVQPVELDKVPPLAIFSAYTLYAVEGSRDGRHWYGLRLGFFSDVISAKQVAGYVRSEFASVAVVPVSPQERGRAAEQHEDAAGLLGAPVAVRTDPSDEFKLFEDDHKPASAAAVGATVHRPIEKAAPAPKPQAAAGRTVRETPAAPARGRGGRLAAGAKRGPQTLEETLEILGASALTIDSGRGETLNDTGVRHLRIEQQKNSPFGRLLERLSERVKKQ